MPAPTPLTATPPPALDWSRDAAPASRDFGDIYFSVEGGLEESRAVFLEGCGLPEGWQGRKSFVIGELGFGTGLNFLAAWQMWNSHKPKRGHLHFISIEKYPLSKTDLARALAAWPELANETERLLKLWPGRVKGIHRLHIAPDVTLTLYHMDVGNALDAIDARIDAWFLDGFSPAKNPDMWSPEIMHKVGLRSAPGARLATFTVAGFVREGLTQAGFTPEKKPGFGRKRDRLEAAYKGEEEPTARQEIRPVIIGGGIAGASLARAFSLRGIRPILIENDQPAASGNPAAIVKPRLDLQDRPESRFFLSSYLYALNAYAETGGLIHQGVRQIPKTDADKKRFKKLAAQSPLPPEHMQADGDEFAFRQAQIIDPISIIQTWKQDAERIQATVGSIKRTSAGWDVFDPNNNKVANGTHVIIAAGFGIRDMDESRDLSLRYSRGQLTWAEPHTDMTNPIAYGGYAIPLEGALLLGATHDRLTDRSPFELTETDDHANIEALKTASGVEAVQSTLPSRASVRVTTADTLPLVAELETNKWVLTGLGSRGFVYAPLLGESLVSKICGEPSPLDRKLGTRFGAREKVQPQNAPR